MLKIESIEEKFVLVDTESGEIINKDLSPKFENYDYANWKRDELRFLEPMTCKVLEKDNDISNSIAEEKFDGHRSLCFITPIGNRFFSRRISKKTGWFAENSDCVPHLRDWKVSPEFYGTVLDGELTMPTGVFADVQGVTGALPDTAIANQAEKGLIKLNVFDILYYKGINIQSMPLIKRKYYLRKVIEGFKCECMSSVPLYATKNMGGYFKAHGIDVNIVESFEKLKDEMWGNGKEGLVVKEYKSHYEQKRSKSWLKVKEVNTYDVVIMGYQEPTEAYDGKTLEDKGFWDYWMDCDDPMPFEKRLTKEEAEERNCAPITKPYAKGWIGAIDCGVYKDGKLVKIAEAKGLSDEDLEKIKNNADRLLGTVIELKAQGVINEETKSLRHPRFSRWRSFDKNAEDCKWEDI